MKPLKGASYSNLFTHYRPVADPEWSTRRNPAGTPQQIKGINHCGKTSDGIVDCDGVQLPFLAKSNEVVNGPNDLFNYWEKIGQANGGSSRVGEL